MVSQRKVERLRHFDLPSYPVVPTQVGIQVFLPLDSRFRGNDILYESGSWVFHRFSGGKGNTCTLAEPTSKEVGHPWDPLSGESSHTKVWGTRHEYSTVLAMGFCGVWGLSLTPF